MAPCFKKQGTGIKKLTIGGRTLTMKPKRTDTVLALAETLESTRLNYMEPSIWTLPRGQPKWKLPECLKPRTEPTDMTARTTKKSVSL